MEKLIIIMCFSILLNGCSSLSNSKSPFMPAQGLLYSNVKYPLTTNFNNVETSVFSGEADFYGVGYSIFSFGFGDGELKRVLRSGDLSKAYYADLERTYLLLGMYHKTTLRVYGKPEKLSR